MNLCIAFDVKRRFEKISQHPDAASLDETLKKFRTGKTITESAIF